jgi:hypothetical protein
MTKQAETTEKEAGYSNFLANELKKIYITKIMFTANIHTRP